MSAHITPGQLIWWVEDPRPLSVVEDICFPATLDGLIRQARGGIQTECHLTAYLHESDATADAVARLARRDAR